MTENSDTLDRLNELVDENRDLRRRLDEVRKHAFDSLDRNDKLRRELKQRQKLMGPGFRYPSVCSDGRAWAVPAEAAREETIRWFAGHALNGLLSAKCADDSAAVTASALLALDLWDELEATFKIERQKRADAESAVAKVAEEMARDETEVDEDL